MNVARLEVIRQAWDLVRTRGSRANSTYEELPGISFRRSAKTK